MVNDEEEENYNYENSNSIRRAMGVASRWSKGSITDRGLSVRVKVRYFKIRWFISI